MKNAIILLLLASFTATLAQAQKLITKTAHVKFYSHTPVEDIEAHNNQTLSVIDTESGAVAFSLLMKSFEFEKALMQEHFNEKYVESDKYPKATFKGSIQNLADAVNFDKNGSYEVEVMGTMSIHGVDQKTSTKGTITVADGQVSVNASFLVAPGDYDISIPGVVAEKIAKEIEVTVEASYQK